MKQAEMKPTVYYRLTDNWLELTVRFIVSDHGIRPLKDAMSRDILRALDDAGIGIASATFEIVGLPPLRFQGKTAPMTPRHRVRARNEARVRSTRAAPDVYDDITSPTLHPVGRDRDQELSQTVSVVRRLCGR